VARRKGTGIPGLSFSWKRALGISQAKSKLSRQIGMPISKSGRQRKFGATAGCLLPVLIIVVSVFITGAVLAESL